MPKPMRRIGSASRKAYTRASTAKRNAAYGRTAVRVPRRNTYNKPVAAALRRPRRPVGRVGRNRTAITTLARQVQLLKSQKFGIIQTQMQYTQWTGSAAPLGLPEPAKPVAFLVNNFYEMTAYRGIVTGTTGTFEDNVPFVKQTYDASLDDNQEWLARMNTDVVSPNAYLPVYTRINLRFNFRSAGSVPSGWIRLDLVKIRDFNTTNKISTNLPTALGAFRNLCIEPSDPLRNYYNPEFHQVLSTSWIRVTNRCKAATESADFSINRQITRKFNHGDFVDCNFNDHPTGQVFWTNTPRHQQVWLMMSLDQPARDMLRTIDCGRLLRWRDHHAQA